MYNTNIPKDHELPSSNKLLNSTLIALVVAIILLFTVILPAEYGVDPTGVGKMLGLTEMGEIKQQLAKEAEQDAEDAAVKLETPDVTVVIEPPEDVSTETVPVAAVPNEAIAPETLSIQLKPGDAAELKLGMKKDAVVTFQWSVDTGHVNYDTHADGEGIKYFGYGKGIEVSQDQGELIAAFDGMHGWYWRNRSKKTVVVTLVVSGEYDGIKRVL